MSKPTISVIIPTTCDARREKLLHRALSSIHHPGMTVQTFLVVNGSRVDEGLLQRLSTPGINVIRLEEGNVSKARYAGLQASTGEFFCFLDDDDEFLPGALAHRLALFEDGVDCVVTNGWEYRGQDKPLVPPAVAAMANTHPAQAFMRHNWFASPGSMFRRSTMDLATFDIQHKFFEWTLLFFRLIASGKRIKYDNALTYRKFENNPLSASQTDAYKLANADFLGELLTMPLGDEVLSQLRRKHHSALNAKTLIHLERRQRIEAWKSHLSCLKSGGWRYLPFTRKLIF